MGLRSKDNVKKHFSTNLFWNKLSQIVCQTLLHHLKFQHMLSDSILDMFEFQHFRVKVAVAILEKLCCHFSTFTNELILEEIHTNVKCDNVLDKFVFLVFRSKVKVTAAVLRKTLSYLYSPFIYGSVLI